MEIVRDRSEAYPEIAIRVISELPRIEISIFNLFTQLPNLEQGVNQDYPSRYTTVFVIVLRVVTI